MHKFVCTGFSSCRAASKSVYHEHVLSCPGSYTNFKTAKLMESRINLLKWLNKGGHKRYHTTGS